MSGGESFARMYSSVIKDRRVSETDFRVLAFIKSFSDKWRVNQEYISRELGFSMSTVIRSVNRLDAAGYLTYDIKITRTGKERRNMRMQHHPSHWNEVGPNKRSRQTKAKPKSKMTEDTGKTDTAPLSEMKGPPTKDDMPTPSNLTPNEELTDTSNAESATKSQDIEKNGALSQNVIRSLWERYNAVPEGYIQIEFESLGPTDQYHAVRLCEESMDVLVGLQQKPGQKTEYNCDAFYYEGEVLLALERRERQPLGPARFYVRMIGEAFELFISPKYMKEIRLSDPRFADGR